MVEKVGKEINKKKVSSKMKRQFVVLLLVALSLIGCSTPDETFDLLRANIYQVPEIWSKAYSNASERELQQMFNLATLVERVKINQEKIKILESRTVK